jgi:NAD(P)-dependent dehydrogenase (short-subunit alcohol dehydrogenase family)
MASMSGTPDPTLTWTPATDLAGKRIVVVGGTDGLGRAIARLAAARGARVTVVGRTLRDPETPGITFVRADLSSMKEADRLGETLEAAALDAVVLTTGIMAAPERQVTDEGLERDMAVSYLSRLALLRKLVPRLRDAARVFVMGFPGAGNLGEDVDDLNAERGYDAMRVHMNTVAGNEMLVLDWARKATHVGFYGLNPGLVKTAIRSNYLGDNSWKHRLAETFIGWLTPTPERYAERVVPLLFARELDGRSGAHFNQKVTAIRPSEGMDPAHVARFLAASTALVDRAVAGA